MGNAINQIIPCIARIHQSGRSQFFDEFAIFCKVIELVRIRPGVLNDPISLATITIFVKIVFVAIDHGPGLLIIRRAIIVSRATIHGLPNTGSQSARIIKGVIDITPVMRTNGSTKIFFPEVMPLAIDQFPSGGQLANHGIAVSVHACIPEQTAVLRLTNVNTILTKVIVVTVHQLDSGKFCTIDIVGKTTIFIHPAIFQGFDQCVTILEFLVGITKGCTSLAGIIGIDKGQQSIGRLVFRLLCKRIQTGCTQTDVITDLAAMHGSQTMLLTPECIIFRCQFNATDNAQGICRIGINCLGLLFPLQC